MIAAKNDVQYMLRLPERLRDTIKQRAAVNGRSVNTEIIAAIESALCDGDRLTQIERRLDRLERLPVRFWGQTLESAK